MSPRPQGEIMAELAKLKADQSNAPTWGAAVGARHESIKALTRELEDSVLPMERLFALPDYMREGVRRWVLYGIPSGGFLMAVFRNDLVGAVRNADTSNQYLLRIYIDWLLEHAPGACWGNEVNCLNWQLRGGLLGPQK